MKRSRANRTRAENKSATLTQHTDRKRPNEYPRGRTTDGRAPALQSSATSGTRTARTYKCGSVKRSPYRRACGVSRAKRRCHCPLGAPCAYQRKSLILAELWSLGVGVGRCDARQGSGEDCYRRGRCPNVGRGWYWEVRATRERDGLCALDREPRQEHTARDVPGPEAVI